MAVSIIGRKALGGVETYAGYLPVLDEYKRTGRIPACWKGQYFDIEDYIPEGRLLDVSGEPGFFGVDAERFGHDVTVTAYAPEVAEAMKETFGFQTYAFDYNADHLNGGPYNAILSRNSIGFCLDAPKFMSEVAENLERDGVLIVQHSPYTRGMALRWMFDDYTYLIGYSSWKLIEIAGKAGLELVTKRDDGPYRYDNPNRGVWWPALTLAKGYRALHPHLWGGDLWQQNETLVFKASRA